MLIGLPLSVHADKKCFYAIFAIISGDKIPWCWFSKSKKKAPRIIAQGECLG